MKFAYARYEIVASPADPERTDLYRPVIPVRFVGPTSSKNVYALLDTGADECFITESMAKRLGVGSLSGGATVQSAGGAIAVTYGRITIEVSDGDDAYSFPATVGIVSEEWSEAILGHVGFLEYFDATFSYSEKLVTLMRRENQALTS